MLNVPFYKFMFSFNTRIRIRIRNTDPNPTTQVNHTDRSAMQTHPYGLLVVMSLVADSATRDTTTNIGARANCVRVKVHNLV